MELKTVLMVSGIFVTLLFLQLSCGTMREYSTDLISADVVKAGEGMLLVDKHELSGIECNDCHEEMPPDSFVPKVVCLTCHEDYKEVAASYLDPHNAHIEYSGCGDCHHAHRPSEKICQGCHTFSLQAP
jgi:fumarate reductase flavoprotein subunit